jgi:hypothetical protein
MICEWCGKPGLEHDLAYSVTLPGGCCSFLICGECVKAGEERGGGTAVCWDCGHADRVDAFTGTVMYWKRRWYRRKIRVTHYLCRGGCRE